MYLQCNDGFAYENPTFEFPRSRLLTIDDELYLYHKGRVTWRTARKNLGLRLLGTEPDAKTIINEVLESCSVFWVAFRKMPAKPEGFESKLSWKSASELSDVPYIRF